MNLDEYYILFHKNNLNLVAFKRVVECSEEILSLVNTAIDAERKEWVGLTDVEIEDSYHSDYKAQTEAIEAKLKERNSGRRTVDNFNAVEMDLIVRGLFALQKLQPSENAVIQQLINKLANTVYQVEKK
jgi:hypothetical protein